MIALFLRAWLQVFLVALNVQHIRRGRYGAAFVTGAGISTVWWMNAHTAAHADGWVAMAVYVLGAGLGTVSGMWAGSRSWR